VPRCLMSIHLATSTLPGAGPDTTRRHLDQAGHGSRAAGPCPWARSAGSRRIRPRPLLWLTTCPGHDPRPQQAGDSSHVGRSGLELTPAGHGDYRARILPAGTAGICPRRTQIVGQWTCTQSHSEADGEGHTVVGARAWLTEAGLLQKLPAWRTQQGDQNLRFSGLSLGQSLCITRSTCDYAPH
jgi:hypothetical protein